MSAEVNSTDPEKNNTVLLAARSVHSFVKLLLFRGVGGGGGVVVRGVG